MNYFVYILKCNTGEYYKGLTSTIDRRITDHEYGKVDFTRNKRPLKLVHVEVCFNRSEARKIEKFYKSGFGKELI